MGDETKNSAEFLVTVPFDTKKRLSCTIKQFPTLVKETLESLSLTPEQILMTRTRNWLGLQRLKDTNTTEKQLKQKPGEKF